MLAGSSSSVSAEVAVAIVDGDCARAAEASVAIERVAAVLGAEPFLPFAIAERAVEVTFHEAVQKVVFADLSGSCRRSADWARVRRAQQHLERLRLPLPVLFAAEGTLVTHVTSAPGQPFLLRWGGPNVYNLMAPVLGVWADLSFAARHSGPEAAPPELPLPARLLGSEMVAELLRPNLSDLLARERRARAAESLTRFAVRLPECARDRGCTIGDLELPRTPDGAVAVWVEDADGPALFFEGHLDASSQRSGRDRRTVTLRLPRGTRSAA